MWKRERKATNGKNLCGTVRGDTRGETTPPSQPPPPDPYRDSHLLVTIYYQAERIMELSVIITSLRQPKGLKERLSSIWRGVRP